MKILNWTSKASVDSSHREFEIVGEYLKEEFSNFNNLQKISGIISEKLANDLYPDIKALIMRDPHFQTILNEINLLVAKKFIN